MNYAPIVKNVLNVVSILYPPAAPIIGTIQTVLPYIIAAEPYVVAAVKNGSGALAAIKEVNAKLHGTIEHAADSVNLDKVDTENLARSLFGFSQMTIEEEIAWMDRYDPISKDSRSGSG